MKKKFISINTNLFVYLVILNNLITKLKKKKQKRKFVPIIKANKKTSLF